MSRFKRNRIRGLMLALVLGLLLAACGGEEDAAPESEEPSEPEAATEPEPEVDEEEPEVDEEEPEAEEDWPTSVTFGVTPADDAAGQEERFGSMIEVLEEDLGIEIEYVTATSYAGLVEAMISGDLDMMVTSPFAYVIATNNGADVEARAAYIRTPDAEPTYQSFGIKRADNDEINGLEDYAGKQVCFVDPGSASGFLVPSAGLLDVGVDPETGVGEAIFAGGHDNSVLAVADGSCEAGFAVDSMVPRLEDTGEIDEGEIEIIWESSGIAGVAFSVQRSLPESFRDAATAAVVENNSEVIYERDLCHPDWVEEEGPTGKPVCLAFGLGVWGFSPVDDALYDGIREVCTLTEAPACVDPEA